MSDWGTPEEYRQKALADFELKVDQATMWAASVKYPDLQVEEVLDKLRPLMRTKLWNAMSADTQKFLAEPAS